MDRSVLNLHPMTKSEKTRQFIIEQSAALMNKRGVLGTSIADVMEATRLAKGGIYGNFQSKEEISIEAFNYLAQRLSARVDAILVDKANAKLKLFALLDFYHDSLALGDGGGCPLLNFGTEADDTNPDMRQRVAKVIKARQQRISKLVEQGKEEGLFKSTVDAQLFAVKTFSLLEGAIFTSRVMGSKAQMKTIVDLLKKEIETFSK